MKDFMLTLITKVKKFSKRKSYSRSLKKCISCGDCDECSLTGICTIERDKIKYSDEVTIED